MNGFNLDQYLAGRQADNGSKFDEILRARDEKLAALNSKTPAKQAALDAKAPSWVERMGINDKYAAGAVNLLASVFSGTARMAGDVLSLPADALAAAHQSELSEEQIAAYSRSATDQALPGDLEILNGRVRPTDPNSETVLQRIQRIDHLRSQAAGVDKAFDVSSVVDKTNQAQLVNQLGDGFTAPWETVTQGWKEGKLTDVATGLGQLIYRAGEAAWDNPQAASEFIAENLPQLVVGATGKAGRAALTSSNIGYGIENYRKGIEKYQSENNGALPPEDVRQQMALAAAATVAAEQVGDLAMLRNAKALGGAADGAEDAVRTGFKQSLWNTTKAGVSGTVSEAVTEGFQTFAEGEAQLEPASAKKIYTGAAIGGMVGGALSGGGRAVAEAAGATPEQAAAAQQQRKKSEVFKEAVEKGDATAFADPGSETYDPRAAVSVLQEASKREDATPEKWAENFSKAMEVLQQVDRERQEMVARTPEGKAEIKESLEEAKAAKDDAEVARLQALMDLPVLQGAELERARKEYDAKDAQLDKLYNQLGAFQEDNRRRSSIQMKVEDVQAQVSAATAQDASPEAVEAVINLSMAAPEALTSEQALALANSRNTNLTSQQRNYLRALSDAKVAENKLTNQGKVSNEVLYGDPKLKQLGIATYKQRFALALAAGNAGEQNKQLRGLSSFLASHRAKATLVQRALEMAKANQNTDGYQVLRTADGRWEMRPVPANMNDAQMAAFNAKLRKNGGLRIHMGSDKLVGSVVNEAKAIDLALTELKKAQALKNAPKQAVAAAPVLAPAPVAAPAAPSPAPVPAPAPAPTAKEEPKTETEPRSKQASEPNETQAATAEAQPAAVADQSREVKKPVESEGEVSETQAEAVEEVATEQVTDQVAESASLDVFGEASTDENTPYQKRNLIADFLIQKKQSERDASPRPLVAVKDFLSSLRAGKVKVEEFLAQGTPAQQSLLQAFSKFTRAMEPLFQSNAFTRAAGDRKTKDGVPYADFRYQNVAEFLVKNFKTGNKTNFELEENVRTAMSYAAFSWLDARATLDAANSDDVIRSILGLPDEAQISMEARQRLVNIGTRSSVVANALGKAAAQALGLKAKKQAPANVMAQLHSTLGAAILKGMLDQGVVVRETVTAEQFQAMGGKAAQGDAVQYFIAPAKDSNGNMHPWITAIQRSTKGTNGYLDKLFGAEGMVRWPSLEPLSFSQKLAKNTRQKVPAVLARILDRANKQANYVNPDMMLVLSQFMDKPDYGDMLLEMAGAEDLSQPTHKVNLVSRQAKNENLMRELSRLGSFVTDVLKFDRNNLTDLLDKPMYFEHEVWKTQRVGIATNGINPQASKIHRHMLFRKAWETEVKLDDVETLNNFKLRVMESMGVKTEQKGNAAALASFDAMFDSTKATDAKAKKKAEDFEFAIDAIQTLLNGGELDDDARQDIVRGVKAGGENFQSLSALVAMAGYKAAIADGRKSFTSRLMGEIDGVTNGPMLSHLLLGAADAGRELMPLLNKGGFYSLADGETQYSEFRSAPGNQDLYETTTAHVLEAVDALVQERPGLATPANAIVYFTGALDEDGKVTKAGRNVIKKPLTAFHFGSSLAAAVDGMAEGFIEAIYDKFEKLAREDGDPGEAIQVLNKLLWRPENKDQVKPVPVTLSTTQLLQYTLSPAQVAAIKENFDRVIGQAVKATFRSDFATFIQNRQQLNNAAQLAYTLYSAVYQSERARYVQELIDAGQLPVNSAGKPIADLSAEQLVELDKRLMKATPVMATEMAKRSNSLASGMKMAKSGYRLLSGNVSPVYSSTAQFAQPFADNGSRSLATQGEEMVEEGPGVAMVVTSVHSTDSAISHFAAYMGDVLNIHDAHGAGLANFYETGRNLNAATWDAVLNYSPAAEMYAALERTVSGVATLLSENGLSPEAAKALKLELLKRQRMSEGEFDNSPEVLEAELPGFDLEAYIRNELLATKGVAFRADQTKLDVLAQLQAIDQYALEGGNYLVTDADRQEANDRKSQLSPEVGNTALDAVAALAKAVNEPGDNQAPADQGTENMELGEANDLDGEESGKFDDLFRPAQAMQLLEAALLDRNLSDEVKDAAQLVREALWNKAASTLNGAFSQVPREIAGALRAWMKEKFHSIPRSTWDQLGMPVMQSDPQLVALFEERGELSADQVLTWLGQHFTGLGQDFNVELAKQLRRLVDPNLRIRYVNSATAGELIMARPQGKARGWYHADGLGSREIYVMSPEFVYSGLTAEILLHELTHAGLANTIALAQQKTRNAHDRQMVDELETLRTLAQAFLADKPELRRELGNATADVQELVAWGMTNRTFQEEVLAKIEMPSANTAKVEKRTGAMAFLKALVGLLFRNGTKAQENGLAVLMTNVAGLYDTAAKQKSPIEAAINQSQAAPDPMHRVGQWSTQQIFRALGNTQAPNQLSDAFREHLEGLLSQVVSKLHGGFGYFKANAMQNQATTPLDVWQKALATGEAPFVSEITGRIAMSDQEAFVIEQIEATVRAAIADGSSHTSVAYAELAKLYREVAEKLTPADFGNDQDLYNLVFEVKSGADNRSDYLPRFVALGLAHARFNEILSLASDRYVVRRSDKTFEERLHTFLRRMLDWFNRQLTGVQPGEAVNLSLQKLVGQLVDIEAKKRIKLAMPTPSSKFSVVEEAVAAGAEKVRNAALAVAKSDLVRNSSNGIVQGLSGVTRIVVNEQVEKVLGGILQLRDQHFKESQGLAAGLVNYVKGPAQKMQELLREAKHHEKQRKEAITDVAKAVQEAFGNTALTDRQKQSLTRVFLRTGVHVLVDDLGLAGLDRLLDDSQQIEAEIKKRLGAMGDNQFAGYYAMQAKALGYFKVTGQAKSKAVMMNASNIARLFGSSHMNKVTEQQAAAVEPIIDQLATLYALQYMPENDKLLAKDVLRQESNRQDGGNGVEMLLKLHRTLEKESQERLFGASKALMMKGYTPEILNPHTDVKVARTPEERKSLEEMGYAPAGEVELDPDDPNQGKATLHVLKDGGLAPHLTGTIAYTGMAAKGSKVYGGQGFFDPDSLQNNVQTAALTATRQSQIDQMITNPSAGWDPRKVKGGHMVPVVNPAGQVVAWRYMMQEGTKDSLLERNSRPEQVLGMLAGSIMDKETVTKQNSKVLQALYEVYQAEYTSRPDSFVLVAANSPDPEIREMYRLLPDDTQRAIQSIWGSEGLRVPYELLDITFGYRKLSLAKAFDKKARGEAAQRRGEDPREQDELNAAEEFLTWFVEHTLYAVGKFKGMDHDKAITYSKRGAVVIRRGERIWQELAREVKDIIVVKSAVVLLGNIKSNISLLAIHGVPLKAIWEHHRVALRGALDYQRDRAALAQLEIKLGTAYVRGDEAKIRREIAILKDSIERNPVKELIDAGLMPTIVEDVEMEDDLYSYKSLLARKTQQFSDKLNPEVVRVGKWIYMTHDTPIYKTLSQITQLSDFVARYVMYQHLISRENKPLAKQAAIQEASEAFVNYDIPMHRSLQYMDDMGILPFTKYFLSIQRVLLKLTREQPARVLTSVLVGNYLSGLDMVTDSSMIHRVGNNPLDVGALKYPFVLDDLATSRAALSLIK